MLSSSGTTSGPVFEFLVLFAVILLGPIVLRRLGLPGLIGLVLGGFVIGAHGLGLIHAGNQTVPELGHLGLLYLMFVAGLELDLHVLRAYRKAAVGLGLLAFVIPGLAGIGVGWMLGWPFPARCLLGALVASHTLIVYPTLRDAGLDDDPAVASAVGATVLTDTLALIVLAVVAGSQTDSGSTLTILGKIGIGFVVLLTLGLIVLPRLVDAAFRYWGADRIARYLVIIVALLAMAFVAQLFGIEGIVGAFFAGLALNPLVPNEGPSMEQVEFFGTAVFVPVFLVSIGLLLDPSVMFTGEALKLAAYICTAALGGKAIACWTAGTWLGFSRPQRAAMYVLTAPQAAATLAVTLVGFEIGLFGTTVVNAVLVLILVSIVASALLTEKVIQWLPARRGAPRLGAKVLVLTPATGPSDAAIRAATLLSRPDGGHSDLVITREPGEAAPDRAHLRAIETRISRHGFEGHVHADADPLPDAVAKAVRTGEHSLLIVDDPTFEGAAGVIPLLVVDGITPTPGAVLQVADPSETDGIAAEIGRRLAIGHGGNRVLRKLRRPDAAPLNRVTLGGAGAPAEPDPEVVATVPEPASE
jgi:Kef-type K+ transport system membrane component KefB